MLGGLAATVYGRPSERLTVVGITGTSGKTTTTYLVESGLRAGGRMAGLIGTIGIRIDGADLPSALTTPEAPALQALLAAMAERGVDTVVMEVSSHALTLAESTAPSSRSVVSPTCPATTSTSTRRWPTTSTPRRVLRPGIAAVRPPGVVCVDDDAGRAMAALAGDAITVSARPARRLAGEDVVPMGAGGQEFTAIGPDGAQHRVGIRLPGRYNVANCLVALAILEAVGGTPNWPRRDFCRPAFRGDWRDRPRPGLSRASRLRAQAGRVAGGADHPARPGRRLAVVFGAVGDRDPGKRAPMGAVAAELADLVVVTDDNPAVRIRRQSGVRFWPARPNRRCGAGGRNRDRRSAIRHAVDWAGPGDVVLVAGKGHETGQRTGTEVRPFDDRVELALALEALGARG